MSRFGSWHFNWHSAILIGKKLDAGAEIVTIEIYRSETEIADKNIVKANIPPKVKIILGDAIKVIPTCTIVWH